MGWAEGEAGRLLNNFELDKNLHFRTCEVVERLWTWDRNVSRSEKMLIRSTKLMWRAELDFSSSVNCWSETDFFRDFLLLISSFCKFLVVSDLFISKLTSGPTVKFFKHIRAHT